MRCETAAPLLPDYADRSLPLAKAWQVRRHIQNCADCQKSLADIQAFGREVRALYAAGTVVPSPMLRTRTLQGIEPLPSVRRRLRAGGVAAFGGAAMAAAVAAALVWLTPGTPVRPTVAFAQVEAAMQQVKTVHWIETSLSAAREGEPPNRPMIVENWAQLEPPLWTQKRLSGLPSINSNSRDNYFHSVTTAHERIMHDSIGDVYTITNTDRWASANGWDKAAMLRNWIISDTISPGDISQYAHPITRSASAAAVLKKTKYPMPTPSPWRSRTVTEKGQELLLFERDNAAWEMPNPSGKPFLVGATMEQIWVASNTHRVVRRKRIQYFPDKHEIAYQTDAGQFRYNESLPPSIFELVPPPGANVQYEEEKRTQPVWDTLTAREKQKIQTAISASDTGWRTGDFATFASAWDFEYAHTLVSSRDSGAVRRQQWAFRVTHQKNNWADWRSTVTAASTQNFLYPQSFKPGTPDLLSVAVSVHGKPKAAGGRQWQGTSTFFLRRSKNGDYKIVDWDEYSLWMAKALPSLLEHKGTR